MNARVAALIRCGQARDPSLNGGFNASFDACFHTGSHANFQASQNDAATIGC
jgi:hypothetical protein